MAEVLESDPPLVSVVVPVHNAEKYLGECLDSLLAQTLSRIEIIVVDDASTDRSKAIASSRRSDPRVRLLEQPINRGASAARNAGIEAAGGLYVGFVDSDDFVSPEMFEILYVAAAESNADIVSCGHSHCDADGNVRSTFSFPLPANTRLDHPAVREALHSAWERRILWFPWRNIYRRELLQGKALRFESDIRFGEDSYFNLQAFFHADGYFVVDQAPYVYRRHPGSVTAVKGKRLEESAARLYARTTSFYAENGFDERAQHDLNRYVLGVDLPTLLSNAAGDPRGGRARQGIATILQSEMVTEALRDRELSQHGFPAKVKIILILSRHGRVRTLHALLWVSAALKRTGRSLKKFRSPLAL